MVVDDPHQIDPVHALELKGEDIDLPERVGYRTFETTYLRGTPVGRRWRIAQSGIVDHHAYLLGTCRQAIMATQFIADAPDTVLGVLTPMCLNPFIQF